MAMRTKTDPSPTQLERRTMTNQFEVEKFARGGDGRWFGFGAKRFSSFAEARAYFEAFAREQERVLSNGIRIDLRERRGRKTLARVGGRMTDATMIREVGP